MVVPTREGIEVKARRKLDESGAFEALLEEIQTKITAKEGQTVIISDLDISQNKLTFEQFEALFTQLGANSVRVLRFRMFGCATLNDEVMRVIADYFRLLTQETAPTEMHLSDCAITAEGFLAFMGAMEEGELYPLPSPTGGKPLALYMRLENNYIDEAAIKEKVESGLIKPYKKQGYGSRSQDPTIKVDLVVRDEGRFQQKTGEPPSPEDAPPPKLIYDKYWEQQQQGAQGAWPQKNWPATAAQGWQQNSWGQQAQVRPAAVAWNQSRGTTSWATVAGGPPAGGGVAGGVQWPRPLAGGALRPVGPVTPSLIKPLFGQQGAQVGMVRPGMTPRFIPGQAAAGTAANRFGAAGLAGAQDRSRTPVARNIAAGGGVGVVKGGGKGAVKAVTPPAAAKNDMPHPWEEHWSEEYQIPYYWNSESGEALWERPS